MEYVHTTFTMVDETIIDCRLHGIYSNICKGNIDKAVLVINETIRSVQRAQQVDCEKEFVNHLVNELYLMLVNIAMGRIHAAHDKIRNLHYSLAY